MHTSMSMLVCMYIMHTNMHYRYMGATRRMLTYADVCWRMLTYADVCIIAIHLFICRLVCIVCLFYHIPLYMHTSMRMHYRHIRMAYPPFLHYRHIPPYYQYMGGTPPFFAPLFCMAYPSFLHYRHVCLWHMGGMFMAYTPHLFLHISMPEYDFMNINTCSIRQRTSAYVSMLTYAALVCMSMTLWISIHSYPHFNTFIS